MSNVLHNVAMKPGGGEVSYSEVVKVCTQDQLKKTGNQRPAVHTRLFFNSKVSKKNVESLLAKGNKMKSLKHGTEPRGKRIKTGGVTRPKCAHSVTSENYKQNVTSHDNTAVSSIIANRVQEGDSKAGGPKTLLHLLKLLQVLKQRVRSLTMN